MILLIDVIMLNSFHKCRYYATRFIYTFLYIQNHFIKKNINSQPNHVKIYQFMFCLNKLSLKNQNPSYLICVNY